MEDTGRTAWLLCLLPQTLFECALVLLGLEVLCAIVFREHAVALAVEDDEGVDAVEGQVHLGRSLKGRAPSFWGAKYEILILRRL